MGMTEILPASHLESKFATLSSALSAHERAYLERQIRRHRFGRPFKWTKSADQILGFSYTLLPHGAAQHAANATIRITMISALAESKSRARKQNPIRSSLRMATTPSSSSVRAIGGSQM
jgi:hypothetical protein